VAHRADRDGSDRAGRLWLTLGGTAPAALMAVVLLACCAGGPLTVPGPGAGRLRQVLRTWSAFPASATPRPLVLLRGGRPRSAAGPR
jgi:hypothetical protein